jgi:pimeloyl-ACP methyl ester carboxylesterase
VKIYKHIILVITLIIIVSPSLYAKDCVIFFHGLARTSNSMDKIALAFLNEGYEVANIDYPSRKLPIEELAGIAVRNGLEKCSSDSTTHFVTHSLGGILVRYYFEKNTLSNLGRVVMLAPPNQGSEVVDNFRNIPGYTMVNGPAGSQLGTTKESVPSKLGAVDFELGIIAGTKSVNIILSQFLPNPDDGKVSTERTKVEGMRDFITVPHSHPFIMQSPDVIKQTILFIKHGYFDHEKP